jgi:ketosteroid isomerase-like protein
MNDFENRILEVLEAYKAAAYERDVDAFLRLYDPEARVFDAWDVWSYEGAAARRSAIEQWFTSLGAERVKVIFDDVQITAGQDLAVVSAIGAYAAFSVDGKELRSMQNRFTWALKLEGNAWKIVHEHTSTPISSNDTKAIFHREKAA